MPRYIVTLTQGIPPSRIEMTLSVDSILEATTTASQRFPDSTIIACRDGMGHVYTVPANSQDDQ